MSYHLKPGKLYRLKFSFDAKEVQRDGFFVENSHSFRLHQGTVLLFVNSPCDRMADFNPRLFDQNVFLYKEKLISFTSPTPDKCADVVFEEIEFL